MRTMYFDLMRSHPTVDQLRRTEAKKYDSRYFSDDYWKEDLPGKSGNRSLSYDDPLHTARFSLLFDAIIGVAPRRRLLDVGCGPGLLLERALNAELDAWGVELSPHAKELFLKRTDGRWPDRLITGSMASLPFSTSDFDLILCFDALEHLIVFDVFSAVSELCRVANGQIICSINLDNPYHFHPTILSKQTWIALFESTGQAIFDAAGSRVLSEQIQAHRPEYEMFCFKKLTAKN